MKLYFHPMSGNSRRVLLTAEHLQVPLERVVIDLPKGEQKGAPHLARNPNARVPVLEDGDFVLWESRAIMQYLCDKTPGQTLMPTEARAKADVNRWLSWCAMDMSPANALLVVEHVVKPLTGRATDPAEVERGLGLWNRAAAVLNAHLSGKTWISGERLSLADYSLAAGFALAPMAKMPLGDYPHIRSWFARVQELDAWKRTAPPPPPVA